MKISHIHAGFLKLDGGAMFGIVPKTIWSKLNPCDEKNLCTWAMNCLLVESGDRKILIDTGIGDKQSDKWKSFFEPHGPENLMDSLREAGIRPEEITDVLLTHLHFDHCGGAVLKNESGDLAPAFPNAVYWIESSHWAWANDPNAREKASFLKENFMPLLDAGQVNFFKINSHEDLDWMPGIALRPVFGHTEAMVLPIISAASETFVYCADLIPSSHHVGLPYVMAYDVRPLITIAEKDKLLAEALEENWTLIFEHDPKLVTAKLSADESGRIILNEKPDAFLSK